jgi:hypothetical protein
MQTLILRCLEANMLRGNRLRHRRVGTILHNAPLNLSDSIYARDYVLTRVAPLPTNAMLAVDKPS